MNEPKRRRRGPKRTDGERLEALTIRLPPKLKYGLDLLARAQHRSLSQAVEWALQVGLNGYSVPTWGEGPISIGDVVERVWSFESPGARTLKLYNTAPSLLSFEDTKACEMVDRSHDKQLAEVLARDLHREDHKAYSELRAHLEAIYWRFVEAFWSPICKIAVQRANNGKSSEEVYLLRELKVKNLLAPSGGEFEVMEQMTKLATSPGFMERFEKLLAESHRWSEMKAALDSLITEPDVPPR